MNQVRIGVVGVKGMGGGHCGYLANKEVKGAKLAAVCDIVPEIADHVADVHKVPAFYDHKSMFKSGEIDAVIIATPHYFHPPIGMDAFKSGIHVLSEKPMAVTVSEARKFVRAAKRYPDLKFALMFQMRTEPLYRKIKQMIEKGEIGEIRRANWNATFWFRPQAYYDSGGWRATWDGEGGGVLLNQAPHTLDMFQWLVGMPKTCTAKTYLAHGHDIEVEDDTMAMFEYENGATSMFVTATTDYPGSDRLEIAGDKGTIVIERNQPPTLYKVKGKGVREFSNTTDSAWSTPKVEPKEITYRKTPAGHYVITQNWVDAIRKDTELIAPGEDGINSVELANAMIYSGVTGEEVKFPLKPKVYDEFLQKMIKKHSTKKKTKKGKRKVKNTGPEFHKV